MTIYLIRHTTPLNAKGLCYGFTDIALSNSFIEEAELVKSKLPIIKQSVYSSPLKRCTQLANYLFNDISIIEDENLKELNFGIWENTLWNDIPYEDSRYWMDDFVYQKPPNGESYIELHNRVTNLFQTHLHQNKQGFTWVTHSGVLRSILCYINKVELKNSFSDFSINYGAVLKITCIDDLFSYEIL